MNDPWDVKSVRPSHHYDSFMKINGVPLLPPVLSTECRKEMQYYKLLAREVEKRITTLKQYAEKETVDGASRAPELTDDNTDETEDSCLLERICYPSLGLGEHVYNSISSNVTIKTSDPMDKSTNMMIDLNISINSNGSTFENGSPKKCKAPIEFPERDINSPKKLVRKVLNESDNVRKGLKKQKETLTELKAIKNEGSDRKPIHKKRDGEMLQALRKGEVEKSHALRKEQAVAKNTSRKGQTGRKQTSKKEDSELSPLSKTDQEVSEEFMPYKKDGPSSLGPRSFTGSLQDINAECSKDMPAPLVRQRSYTVLKPSPLLMQHLQLQAKNTGVDLKLISMSESLSNIPQDFKKRRRIWDLETAKNQWSSMALDLKRNTRPGVNFNSNAKTSAKSPNSSSYLPNSPDVCKKPIARYPKSDPIQKSKISPSHGKNNLSERNNLKDTQPAIAANKTKNGGPKTHAQIKESPTKVIHELISAADDPATKVRELYEKIRQQQLLQMASLVEKQKQEQLLLQQLFDEQNNVLFKQLKSICPEPIVQIKQAWNDKDHNVERGPVSLSQLINYSPIQSAPQSPVATTLVPQSPASITSAAHMLPNNCLHHGDKQKQISQMSNMKHNVKPRTRSSTVSGNNASRKLNYDYSGLSSDYEPILTERTNDTMADLNVTFPTDNSDECLSSNNSPRRTYVNTPVDVHRKHINSDLNTDSAIKSLENTIQKTMHAVTALTKESTFVTPTPQQREAATKIVAHAKGYLVRRLMRTERVQATVATIHDALLCALQLHQDREGIRGADVDLHRRLIQQITAACYTLHDTFITSSPAERCSVIAGDRERRRALAARPSRGSKRSDSSQARFGHYSPSHRPSSASIITQTLCEVLDGGKSRPVLRRCGRSPMRRPWRN